jgi:hypothetical protein
MFLRNVSRLRCQRLAFPLKQQHALLTESPVPFRAFCAGVPPTDCSEPAGEAQPTAQGQALTFARPVHRVP